MLLINFFLFKNKNYYFLEEINGVFVKSLVPNSNAYFSKQINVHDLIIEVNDQSLENLSHSDSVNMLISCGNKVKLKLIRFHEKTPQKNCLKILHEQVIFNKNCFFFIKNFRNF